MKLRVVKRSVSWPKSLDEFVMRRAKAKAKPLGKRPNVSEVLSEMVADAKRRDELEAA